jgi:hypothetical protein
MIDLSLTDEQLAIQDLARRFAREEIRPAAAEYDDREEMPWPVLQKAATVGLLSYGLPEEYGGLAGVAKATPRPGSLRGYYLEVLRSQRPPVCGFPDCGGSYGLLRFMPCRAKRLRPRPWARPRARCVHRYSVPCRGSRWSTSPSGSCARRGGPCRSTAPCVSARR